ncbi:hypothetical protein [Luteitalea sp.]|uniref:hypothetical protein n=1 Tax=Luteitalea sp. TaxID=2004800 RepID=UPI0025C0B01B|nr:hypothetical protein [Luteitalea sp.]
MQHLSAGDQARHRTPQLPARNLRPDPRVDFANRRARVPGKVFADKGSEPVHFDARQGRRRD